MNDRVSKAAVLAAALIIWEAAVWVFGTRLLPAPSGVLRSGVELLRTGMPPGYTLFKHMCASLVRVFSGFSVAVLAAVPLGIIMGWSRRAQTLCEPLVQVLRPIPPLAWIPIAAIWLGPGLASEGFIIFLGVFFPVLLSTITGVESVDQVTIKAARTLGAGDRDILFQVLAPGAMPSIITGLRVGLGIGWMSLVAAELIGVKSGYGLGYMIMSARDIMRIDMIIAGMLVIGLVGLAMDTMLRVWERRMLRWREN